MTRQSRNGCFVFPRFAAGLLGLALCVAMSGCLYEEDGLVVVAGKVTFDGQPVEVGEVRFTVAGHATEASPIVMGQYQTRVPKGEAEVAIFAYREAKGNQIAVTGTAPVNENYIPQKYNTDTTLSTDIAVSNKSLDFALIP